MKVANEVLHIGEANSHTDDKKVTCYTISRMMDGHNISLPQQKLTRFSEFIS